MEPIAGWAPDASRQAVEAAYQALGPRLMRFALALGADREQAREAVQETFLHLLRDPALYDASRGPLAALLYGMTRNRLRELRRELRREPTQEPLAGGDWAEQGVDLLEGLTQQERVQSVRTAIAALPAHYREVLVLVELEEQSYELAAQALGLAVGTVRSRLSRGRALLEEKLRGAR